MMDTTHSNSSMLIELKGFVERDGFQFDEEPTTCVMASLSTKDDEEEEEEETMSRRAPVDVVVVLDRSGSMNGTKMELCKETCAFLARELSTKDRFGLVTFDDHVETVLNMTPMTSQNKDKVSRIVGQIQVGGCTNLSGGILAGLKLFAESSKIDNPSEERVRAVLVLTDGHANQGITETEGILSGVKSMMQTRVPRDVRLFTFGYGENHNEQMLSMLAANANGGYYYVENVDDAPTAFSDCLGGLLSVVAQNIRLTIEIAGGAQVSGPPLDSTYKHTDLPNNKGFIVTIPDLYAGEQRDVLLNVKLPALTGPVEGAEDAPIAKMSISYMNLKTSRMEQYELFVGVSRPVFIDPSEAAELVNENVAKQLMRLETIKVMKNAQELARKGNVQDGKTLLTQLSQRLTSESICANDQQLQTMNAEVAAIAQQMEDSNRWQRVGSKRASNKMHEWRQQRAHTSSSVACDDYAPTRPAYSNLKKGTMRKKCASAFRK